MKIYQQTPNVYVRLQIAKLGDETQYLTLIETTKNEVEDMVKEIVLKQNISPFEKGLKTSVNIREAIGGKNGKSSSVSFRGLSPKMVLDLIVEHILTP